MAGRILSVVSPEVESRATGGTPCGAESGHDHDGSVLVDQVDAALGGQNSEYQTKRKSLRYGAPVIRVIRPGECDRYRRRMVETGQRADGQFKVLRLTSDTSFAAERDLVGGARPALATENVSPPRG